MFKKERMAGLFNYVVISVLAGAFFSASFAASVHARESSIAELSNALKSVNAFSANFKQTVRDEDNVLIEQYQGVLKAKRPGKLFWHARAPFEQMLVSDSQNIWFYDVDLKQVTVRKADASLSQTPALILSGDIKALNKHFRIKPQTSSEDTKSSFLLEPFAKNTLFDRLILTLKNGQLYQLDIKDSLQQTTSIMLTDIKSTSISDNTFNFKIPKGVKVIHDE